MVKKGQYSKYHGLCYSNHGVLARMGKEKKLMVKKNIHLDPFKLKF